MASSRHSTEVLPKPGKWTNDTGSPVDIVNLGVCVQPGGALELKQDKGGSDQYVVHDPPETKAEKKEESKGTGAPAQDVGDTSKDEDKDEGDDYSSGFKSGGKKK